MKEVNIWDVGERVCELRKQQGITLKELAEYTGFSVGYLSNLEQGKTSPTLDALRKVTSILKTDIIELITEEEKHRTIVRSDEMKLYEHPSYNMSVELVDFGMDAHLYELITITSGEIQLGPLARHLYPESCIVLEGELTVEMNKDIYTLHKYDSIYIPERALHRIYNLGKKTVVSYWNYQKNKNIG